MNTQLRCIAGRQELHHFSFQPAYGVCSRCFPDMTSKADPLLGILRIDFLLKDKPVEKCSFYTEIVDYLVALVRKQRKFIMTAQFIKHIHPSYVQIVVDYRCWFENLVETSGVLGRTYLSLRSANIMNRRNNIDTAKRKQLTMFHNNVHCTYGLMYQTDRTLIFNGNVGIKIQLNRCARKLMW